jgi:pyruvate/2-oxoglutarate dehydrogenase complex dihydrolipoamide acyltransferase (E2) component
MITETASATALQPADLRGTTVKLTRLRKVIANRMHESLQATAQLSTVVEVDLTDVARLRNEYKASFAAREGVKLSFLPFLAKAAVEALQVYPVINATLDLEGGTVTYPESEHLGIAVDTDRGLLVPVVKEACSLSIAELARSIADVAERTRNATVSPEEMSGGTFTLTNTGSRGALFDTPIVNYPQSAILGTGAVVERPAVVTAADGTKSVEIRSIMYLVLSYDHRIVDGADAARYLTHVKTRLQEADFGAELDASS